VKKVVRSKNNVFFDKVVTWPENCSNLAQRFFLIGGMPSVCGVLDGTLIPIISPSHNEHQFVDRHKKGHSLNVMAVCGPSFEFFHVNPRWPGSVNDARILRVSTLNTAFDDGYRPFPGAVILGDSIYPTKNWLIPPLPGTVIGGEKLFNEAHKKTRATVERAFGILKHRFPVLNKIRVRKPEYAAEIVKCAFTLHNLCLRLEPNSYANGTSRITDIDDTRLSIANEIGEVTSNHRRQELVDFFQ